MFALPSATPMKVVEHRASSARAILSLSSAMAMPSFCTSRASSCLSTLAASCSPRLMSKIAARCVPARSSGLLAIGGDPILHDLCGALRILPDQGPRRRDLLLETRGEFDGFAALPRDAHADRPPMSPDSAPAVRRAAGLVSDFINGRSTRNATTSTSPAPTICFASCVIQGVPTKAARPPDRSANWI